MSLYVLLWPVKAVALEGPLRLHLRAVPSRETRCSACGKQSSLATSRRAGAALSDRPRAKERMSANLRRERLSIVVARLQKIHPAGAHQIDNPVFLREPA
jgi:hypothetical protein